MAKFSGGKYNQKSGVLSYMYAGGKEGKGKGGVSIKKIGEDWYFVNKQGKIRDDVGNGGKLTPTHIQNLEDDKIFDSVNVSSETGVEIPKQTEISSAPGDGVGIQSDGTLSDGTASPLADSNYSLPEMSAPVSDAQKAFTPTASDPNITHRGIVENAPPTLQSGWGGETARFNKKMIGSGYSENTQYIPDAIQTDQNTLQNSNYTVGSEFEQNVPIAGATSLPPETFDASIASSNQIPSYGSTFQSYQGAGQTGLTRGTGGFESVDGVQELAGQNEFTGFGEDRMSGPSYSGMPSDAMQESTTTPGIADQNDSSWGSAAGWDAAGSVMKGVGGLASAYTGIKNYQLARDAHATQQNQWQANYNQRLKAYEDNKALANQEIDAKNRVLKARGRADADLIQHI